VIKFSGFLGGYVLMIRRFFTTDITECKEQRICIEFCFNLKKTAKETHRMLQEVFGDNTMSQRKTFLWYKRFKFGRTSVDDDERSGRPSTSTTPENIAKVREAILVDRRRTIHDVFEIVGLSYGTVQRILTDKLNMRRISAKFVPRLPSDDQNAHRVSVYRELKQQARDDPNCISNIITGDETWEYIYALRLSSSRRSGSRQIHRGRKKRVKFAAMSSPC
jgi:histone-lysine N-methyltransferase SETMAR